MVMIDGPFLIDSFRRAGDRLEAGRGMLCGLDGEIGDGDHGTSMANGFAAINERLRALGKTNLPPAALMQRAADAFLAEVGATVGPLYASGFVRAARLLETRTLSQREVGHLLLAVADGITARGRAELGDKTMIDVWYPAGQAAVAAEAEGQPIAAIARAMREAAGDAAETTITMIAARGRASRLKERSLGHLDPGGASAAIIVNAIADAMVSAS